MNAIPDEIRNIDVRAKCVCGEEITATVRETYVTPSGLNGTLNLHAWYHAKNGQEICGMPDEHING